jgi:hypothetical protein
MSRLVADSAHILHLLDDVHALDDLAENHMLVVQPRRRRACDEELTPVPIRPCVLQYFPLADLLKPPTQIQDSDTR